MEHMVAKQHWMDEVAQDIKSRRLAAVPTVAEGVSGDVPFGYRPIKPDDRVAAFLRLNGEQRQQLFASMPPEQYATWSKEMMGMLTTRFGAAAQSLMPMLQGAPVEALAQGVGLDQDGSMGVTAAGMELTDILGFNPLAD